MVNFGTGFAERGTAGLLVESSANVLTAVAANGLALFAANGDLVVAFYVAELVVLNGQMAAIVDDFGAVVFRQ